MMMRTFKINKRGYLISLIRDGKTWAALECPLSHCQQDCGNWCAWFDVHEGKVYCNRDELGALNATET